MPRAMRKRAALLCNVMIAISAVILVCEFMIWGLNVRLVPMGVGYHPVLQRLHGQPLPVDEHGPEQRIARQLVAAPHGLIKPPGRMEDTDEMSQCLASRETRFSTRGITRSASPRGLR